PAGTQAEGEAAGVEPPAEAAVQDDETGQAPAADQLVTDIQQSGFAEATPVPDDQLDDTERAAVQFLRDRGVNAVVLDGLGDKGPRGIAMESGVALKRGQGEDA
ncbi:hypothetical protein R0K19_22160, partial [Bacillus sp. SIMBA_161]